MELTLKKYNLIKTKTLIKNDRLLFIFSGVNRKSNNFITAQQKLKTLDFFFYKILNNITQKILKTSIYNKLVTIINSVVFFLKKEEINLNILFNNLELIHFVFLSLKLNNKHYCKQQLERTNFFIYDINILKFLNNNLINIKKCRNNVI